VLRELLPAPLNQIPSDALETQPKEIEDPVTHDKTIIPAPETIVAKVYDMDLQSQKRRQQAEESETMETDDDEGGGGTQQYAYVKRRPLHSPDHRIASHHAAEGQRGSST